MLLSATRKREERRNEGGRVDEKGREGRGGEGW
jgi:hypothetical protein